METLISGFGLNQILIIGFVIIIISFILKKLFKIAITIVVLVALLYYGLPILQGVIPK